MDIPRASAASPFYAFRQHRRLVYVLAAVVPILALGLSLFRSSTSAAAPAVERNAIWTEHVRRGDLVRQVAVQGTLVPEHVQWLSAGSAARVARIVLRAGGSGSPLRSRSRKPTAARPRSSRATTAGERARW